MYAQTLDPYGVLDEWELPEEFDHVGREYSPALLEATFGFSSETADEDCANENQGHRRRSHLMSEITIHESSRRSLAMQRIIDNGINFSVRNSRIASQDDL